jgi:hypothetical protein
MSKELRELGSLHDVSLYVSESVITQTLDNLWYVEEGNINRVTFQSTHGILENKWMVLECW